MKVCRVSLVYWMYLCQLIASVTVERLRVDLGRER